MTRPRRTGPGAVLRSATLGLLLVSAAESAAPPTPGPRPDPGTATPTPSAVTAMRAAVVAIQSLVPPDRPSAATLGEERAGAATIIEPDGIAVTVGYLVLEAARIDVALEDGRRTTARVVGHDFESGLALIQLDAAGAPYPAASVGRSGPLAAGDPVAIVGVGPSGAASGAMAKVTSVGPFVAYWEYLLERAIFVAPHHPGFGGAALVDPAGALVGVVSLRLPAGHMAIPIDLLAPVRDVMIRTGQPGRGPRPWLGVRAIGVGGGIGIASVSAAGPAEAAGLRPGDVIVRVNGESVADVETFYRRLWAQPVDRPLQLAVVREGGLQTISVQLRDRYATFGLPRP